MIWTNSKRVVMFGTIGLWMFVISGCVSQSEHDTKVAELKELKATLVKTQEMVSQLQKDLDASKDRIEQAEQAAKNAESKVEALELENVDLKNQAKKLSEAEKSLSGLQKDLDDAKGQGEESKAQVSKLQKDLDDAKSQVAEARTHASQLQKDLDSAKARADAAENAAKDSEAKIKKLEQENAALQEQIMKLHEAEKKASELPVEPDAAKAQVEKPD